MSRQRRRFAAAAARLARATPVGRAGGWLRRAATAVAVALSVLAGGVTSASPASAATLTLVDNFGHNPTNLQMYEYVPAKLPRHPAVLVVAHWCTGSGPDVYHNTEFASLADRYGFIVVYPSITGDIKCWDVASDAALKHDGSSDPAGVMSMVRWEIAKRGANQHRVYMTGISSGAMLTNVMLADYPDVFKAGSAFMGVPYHCFYTGTFRGWNSDCSTGNITKTPQEWGDLARAAHPGHTGRRPRIQLWHGTQDEALDHHNLGEEVKQWTNVHGVGQTPVFTDQPQPNWTRTRYGDAGTQPPVEANSFQGYGHELPKPGMALLALRFMGLAP
ncbi:PHB depolymerase family esterase [Streptomyces sp. NPDC005900]|uniref:extracellular catalytic domain type 1 short-chain-length polyhydroxyalkanoate depolymerase n=1 Tax=Streptomyces sp. NPDC005900 TaxID=3154569 RepID=UPI0033C7BFAF